MAGAGYKLFADCDVLTAAQVNTYLNQQTVMVFADASARTTALSAVLAEGMVSYLQDTNQIYYYDGSNWLALKSTIGCSVYLQAATVAFTQGAAGTLSWTSEEYDTNAFHDTSTNQSRITIPTGLGGKYLFNLVFYTPLDPMLTYWILFLNINGSAPTAEGIYQGQIGRDENAGSNAQVINNSFVLDLAAGDYVELKLQSNWVTGNKTVYARLQATYLGA